MKNKASSGSEVSIFSALTFNVMQIKTILLFSFFLVRTMLFSQENPAFKATVLSPACKGVCNGQIKVELGSNTFVPLTITLSDGRTSRTIPNVFQSTVIKDICADTWFVSLTPEKLESCQAITQQLVMPSVEFKLRTLNIKNPTGGNQADGSISIEAYAQKDNGEIVNQGYTYTYQWSNGSTGNSISGLGAGNYNVVVTNTETGCQTTGTFKLSTCNTTETPFDIQIMGGIASPDHDASIPMRVNLRPSPGETWAPIPDGYIVEWSWGNQRFIGNSVAIPFDQVPVEVTVKVTDACGRSKTLKRKAVSCGEASEEAKDYFLSSIIPPCIGHSDGGAILEFSTPGGEFSELVLSDGVSSFVIFNRDLGIGFETVGGNYRVDLPSLRGGKTYTVSGILGEECEVGFSFLLQEKDTEKLCNGYDKKNNLCLYNEECNGVDVGPKPNFKVPAFTEKATWEVGEDGKILPACREDLFCLCNGNKIKVERGNEAWETTRVAKYVSVLNDYLNQTGIEAPLARAAANGHDPCGHVKFCTLDPTVTGAPGFFNFTEKWKPPFKPIGNGCFEVTCKIAVVFRNRFQVCNLPRDYDPKPKADGTRICIVVNENLLQMIIWHKRGLLKTLWPGPDKAQKYEGSKLEAFLKQYVDMNYKPLRCARIEFCKNDLNSEPKTDLSNSLCGIGLEVNRDQPVISCEIASLNLGDQWYGSNSSIDKEAVFRNQFQAIQTGIFYCKNNSNYSRVNFNSTPSFLLSEEEMQFINAEPDYMSNLDQAENSLSTLDSTEADLDQVIIQDSLSNEKLLGFGSLTFQNLRIPKGLIQANQKHYYWDYVFSNQEVKKKKTNKIIAQASNWDNNVNSRMEEFDENLKFGFEYTDTLIQYVGLLESDQFLQPKLFSMVDTNIVIAGLLKGTLKLDSTEFIQTEALSAFYFKISRQGKPMSFQLIEQIDTTQGVYFSEMVEDKIVLASGYADGTLSINGQPHALANEEGVFVAKINGLNTQIIQELGSNTPIRLKGVVYSSDTTQLGILIHGIDSVWQAGTTLGYDFGNSLSIISMSNYGVLRWASKIADTNLDLNQIAFSNGARKGVFLGLTYRDSITLNNHYLKSKGQEDIVILKYDTTGAIIQLDTFGTQNGETISQMMLSENVLFFGGEMKGTIKNRIVGLTNFINNTSFDGKVYISAILDTLGAFLPIPDTSDVSETLQLPSQTLEQSAKPIQRSVSIFAFPNPFQDELNLQFHAPTTETWGLVLVDNLGSVVKRVNQQVQRGFNTTKISTALLPAGMYFLQCVAPDGYVMQTIKVVKTR